MQQNLTEWDEDVVSTPEEEYQTFLRGLSWRDGFGIEFVRCSPASGQDLIEKVKRDLPQKKIDVLTLSKPIENLIEIVQNLPNHSEIDILFVVGLEKSLTDYIRTGYGGQGEYYNLDTVPPILSHLNWQRENFRDRFPNLCFAFLLPNFAIKYIIRRAPDFYDWSSGVFEIEDKQLREIPQTAGNLIRKNKFLSFLSNVVVNALFAVYALGYRKDLRKALYTLEIGNVLDELGRNEEAIASYDRAVAIKPDLHEAWNNRGSALFNLGRNEEAIASYDRALQIKPDDHQAWNNRGNALRKLGRYKEAISSYDRALQIKPDDHEAWYNRGIMLFNLGRNEEAIASYDRAVAIKPDLHEAWCNRGFALDELGRYKEAIASYDHALEIKPEDNSTIQNRLIAVQKLLISNYLEAFNNLGSKLFWHFWVHGDKHN
jgi:Flp pilus assembly protein TadD